MWIVAAAATEALPEPVIFGLTVAQVTAIAAILGPVIVALLIFRTTRESNATHATEVEKQAASDEFATALKIQEVVDLAVQKATEPLRKDIDFLKQTVEEIRGRERMFKDIVRRWFQRLRWWQERGFPGEMPLPTAEEMSLLELVDIQGDTEGMAEIRRLTDDLPDLVNDGSTQ
jgi:hypothetical protein